MKISILATLFLLSVLIREIYSQCCQELSPSKDKCLKCDPSMRMFKGHCLFKINNCKQYSNGVECSQCTQGYRVTADGYCQADTLNSAPSTNPEYTDTLIDNFKTNQNVLILDDYSRSAYTILQTSQALEAFIRTFKNGTKYTVINFKGNNKFYQVAAFFYEDVPFLFQLKYLDEANEKHPLSLKGNSHENPNNETDSSNTNSNQTGSVQLSKEYGESGFNFDFLSKEIRQQDQGFLSIDRLIKLAYEDELGKSPLVLAAYIRTKGFTAEYILFYERTDKKLIYEIKSVYNVIRKQSFILSFTETYWRK